MTAKERLIEIIRDMIREDAVSEIAKHGNSQDYKPEKLRALNYILDKRKKILLVSGGAGSGKTDVLVSSYIALAIRGERPFCMATTGTAANNINIRFSEYRNRISDFCKSSGCYSNSLEKLMEGVLEPDASTIHNKLDIPSADFYSNPRIFGEKSEEDSEKNEKYNKGRHRKSEYLNHSVFFIDEASMISSNLMDVIMNRIRLVENHRKKKGREPEEIRLVFFGDFRQLDPVIKNPFQVLHDIDISNFSNQEANTGNLLPVFSIEDIYKNVYGGMYMFDCNSLSNRYSPSGKRFLPNFFFELKENHRIKDTEDDYRRNLDIIKRAKEILWFNPRYPHGREKDLDSLNEALSFFNCRKTTMREFLRRKGVRKLLGTNPEKVKILAGTNRTRQKINSRLISYYRDRKFFEFEERWKQTEADFRKKNPEVGETSDERLQDHLSDLLISNVKVCKDEEGKIISTLCGLEIRNEQDSDGRILGISVCLRGNYTNSTRRYEGFSTFNSWYEEEMLKCETGQPGKFETEEVFLKPKLFYLNERKKKIFEATEEERLRLFGTSGITDGFYLTEGMPVVFTKNHYALDCNKGDSKKCFNGQTGIVVGFEEGTPIIKLRNDSTVKAVCITKEKKLVRGEEVILSKEQKRDFVNALRRDKLGTCYYDDGRDRALETVFRNEIKRQYRQTKNGKLTLRNGRLNFEKVKWRRNMSDPGDGGYYLFNGGLYKNCSYYGLEIEYFPVEPAFSLTYHKAQGQSVDCAFLFTGRKQLFANNSVYLGLSRGRSIRRLWISKKFPLPKDENGLYDTDSIIKLQRIFFGEMYNEHEFSRRQMFGESSDIFLRHIEGQEFCPRYENWKRLS